MTNELETKLIGWLETSAQAIGDFASKEVPPFIHEYLHWKFLECFYTPCASFILCVIFLIITLLSASAHNNPKGNYYKNEGVAGIVGFSTAVSFIAFTTLTFSTLWNVKEAIQIKVAPKVYLMEKATELIKSK